MRVEEHGLRIESRTVYRGRIFSVSEDRVRLPGPREVELEVVHHPGSVVLLPMPSADQIVLVRQYRYVIDRWIWELPAGSLEAGEDPEQGARRECREEVGVEAAGVEHLGAFYPTPGFCTEVMLFYKLTELSPLTTAVARDEDEDLEPHTFSLEEARSLVRSGGIVDMKTIVGLSLIA